MTAISAGSIHALYSSTCKWEINDFLAKSKENFNKHLTTPVFEMKGIGGEWLLQMYTNNSYLTIYLYCKSAINAVVDFVVYNNNGEIVKRYSQDAPINFNDTTWLRCWGTQEFILLNDIHLNCAMLKDGKLTIVCSVTCEEGEVKPNDVLPPLEQISKSLHDDKELGDVFLVAEDKTIRAHKCVLTNKSPVFAAMFGPRTVKIPDVKYDVLIEIIRYMYVGKVNKLDTLAGEIVVAADKYALNDLIIACEKEMKKNLKIENVIEYLRLAGRFRMEELKESAIEFIVQKGIVVTDQPEFNSLPIDIVRKICRSFGNNVK